MDDHKTRLAALSEKLTDVVLTEADPENWPAAGKAQKDYTQQERGDRYWEKKNASATLTLLIKVHSFLGMHTRGGVTKDGDVPDDEAFKLGQQVASAERAANAVLERIQNKIGKNDLVRCVLYHLGRTHEVEGARLSLPGLPLAGASRGSRGASVFPWIR